MAFSIPPLSAAFPLSLESQNPPSHTPASSRFQTMSIEEATRANDEISKQGIDQLNEEEFKEFREGIQSALVESPSDLPLSSGSEEDVAQDSSGRLALKPFKRLVENIGSISPLILDPSDRIENYTAPPKKV